MSSVVLTRIVIWSLSFVSLIWLLGLVSDFLVNQMNEINQQTKQTKRTK